MIMDSLAQLLADCETQRKQFKKNMLDLPLHTQNAYPADATSCTEIIRRMVDDKDPHAFVIMLNLCKPTVLKRCQSFSLTPDEKEDLIQELAMRLFRRINNKAKPSIARTFGEFLNYATLAAKRIVYDWRNRAAETQLFSEISENEEMQLDAKLGIQISPQEEVSERDSFIQSILECAKLSDVESAVLQKRFMEGKKPQQIIAELNKTPSLPTNTSLSIHQIYRALANALQKLKSCYQQLTKFDSITKTT